MLHVVSKVVVNANDPEVRVLVKRSSELDKGAALLGRFTKTSVA